MKNGLKARAGSILLCAFVIGCTFVYGDSGAVILKATPDRFDFGNVKEGEPAVITTTIENVAKTPVEITNVRTS